MVGWTYECSCLVMGGCSLFKQRGLYTCFTFKGAGNFLRCHCQETLCSISHCDMLYED